jgi:energy-coupling factor transport system substrate-specific component
VAAFGWPLLIHQSGGQNTAHSGDAPWIFVGLLPLLLAIVMAELSEGAIDAKAVALLGILAACFAALRVASPGINGFEPEWFLLVLAARVFGRGFGFVLGAVAFFASALITGGWARGCRSRCWRRDGSVSVPVVCHRCGDSRNGCCWRRTAWWPPSSTGCSPISGSGPFVGSTTTYSFVPGLGTVANLHRFILFDLTTSMGFDLTRAVTCAVLILVLGRPVLAALRRASRRAAFEPQIDFAEESVSDSGQ